MNSGRDPAADKLQLQRARILDRAAEVMGRPVAFSNLTMGEVSERSGIPASTILSQAALSDDPDHSGAVEEFRRMLLRRMVDSVSVKLTQTDRDELIEGLRQKQSLQSLVVALVVALRRQFCASPHAPYLLAASSRLDDDPMLAAAVRTKWAEITDDAVFVLELILAVHGHQLPPGVAESELAAALAMALTTELVHHQMLEPPEMPDVIRDGVAMPPAALIVWLLIEAEMLTKGRANER